MLIEEGKLLIGPMAYVTLSTNLFTSRSVIFLINVQFVQHKLFAYDSIITHLRVVNRSQISKSNQCLVLHVIGLKTILMLQVLNRFYVIMFLIYYGNI
jgi:hypothetical protein